MRTGSDLLAAVRGRATDLGFAAAWAGVRALPEPVTAGLFDRVADRAVARNGRGVRQLRHNLRRVLGPSATTADLDDVLARAMRNYARYWMETFRLPAMDAEDVARRCDTTGVEHLDAAREAGRGALLALPHMGNWDVAGIWLVRHGMPFTTVAERLRPEALFDRFVAYRERLGFEVIALTGGERPPSDVLAERLRAGGAVCLVGDRDLSQHGVEVDFFGQPARMPPGPALLAVTTGAALLPVGLWFDGERYGQHIGAPVDIPAEGRLRDRVRAGTQALADAFATQIVNHPADWHMLQKLWISDERSREDRCSDPTSAQDTSRA